MPASILAQLATTPDSTSLDMLESLATLADKALASENDAKDSSVGVAGIQMNNSTRIIGIMENMSRRLQQLETAGAKKKHFNNKPQTDSRASRKSNKPTVLTNANAKPFIPCISKNNDKGQNVLPASQSVPRPTAAPPNIQQSNVAQPIAMVDAPVCYYHQRFGDKARSCRDPCAHALN